MDGGTQTFDGIAYPDAAASDPRRLGWMEGTPPPPERQVRFADDRFLDFPQIRWSLSHMRELVPTVNVWRGEAPSVSLGDADELREEEIDRLAFTDMNGAQRRWDASLQDTYTDGILVLHRGQRIYD